MFFIYKKLEILVIGDEEIGVAMWFNYFWKGFYRTDDVSIRKF